MSDRTRSKIDQLEFSFECVMTMLTEFSNASEKPPLQMRSGITSHISQYEVCLGSRTGTSQAVGSDGSGHLHVGRRLLWPAAMWTAAKDQAPEISHMARTPSSWLRQQPVGSVSMHQALREAALSGRSLLSIQDPHSFKTY